jgi:hypothetical protein
MRETGNCGGEDLGGVNCGTGCCGWNADGQQKTVGADAISHAKAAINELGEKTYQNQNKEIDIHFMILPRLPGQKPGKDSSMVTNQARIFSRMFNVWACK